MAAVPDVPALDIVDLWHIGADDLDDLLKEEIRTWREQLDWDFTQSADLVRRFLEAHALSGFALMYDGEAVAYSYFVCEEHKGLVGDLYVRKPHRSPETESMLLGAVVDRLLRTKHVRRVESQLMLARPFHGRMLPVAAHARAYVRNFMLADTSIVKKLAPRTLGGITIEQWTERRQDDAAQLIASAYRSHIDSEINDQYRSAAGARRFLFNIVQYPGCGSFFAPASWVAVSRETGRVCGLSLASMVAEKTGHITQICVAPSWKGKGLGYELMRESILALSQSGAKHVSLTVTAANENAVHLYERIGFRTRRQFPAIVWEGF